MTTKQEQALDVIAQIAGKDRLALQPEQELTADLGIDSMMAIEIVAEVERQYKVSVPEEELKSLTNFQSVYDLFATKIG